MGVLPGWVVRTIGYALAVLLAAAVAWLVARVVASVPVVSISIAVALLFVALSQPLADLLTTRARLPRWAAALLTLLVLLGAVLGTLFWIGERVAGQVPDLRESFSEVVSRLREVLTRPPLSLPEDRVAGLEDRLLETVTDALPGAAAGAALAVQVLTGTLLVAFLVFFLLKDGPAMWSWAVGWAPQAHRRSTDQAGRLAWGSLTSYVRGTVVVALSDAAGIGLALLLVGNPLTASLTVLTFLGAFVPIVGATVSGVLAVAVTYVAVGWWSAVVVLVAVIGVQQLEEHLLQPLIMGRALHLSPVAIVVAVLAGAVLGGVVGAFVAVPLMAVGYRLVSFYAGRLPASGSGPERRPEPG